MPNTTSVLCFYKYTDLVKWFTQSNTTTDKNEINEINEIDEINKMIENLLEEIEKYYVNFQDSIKNKIKGYGSFQSGTTTRLFVLAYIIKHFPITKIIETGTQHGISSLVIEKTLINCSKKNTKFKSYDVIKFLRPDFFRIAEYVILEPPVRKNFEIDSSCFVSPKDFILFFHDGDHSRENMAFEFEWVYEKLGAKVIVSDDIENNSAFFDFCSRKGITAYGARFDQGPMVGFAFRQM